MTKLGHVTPILRMFDEAKAREFYIEFLGFAVDFEHRYNPEFPLYMGISRAECRLHLSAHHGDACPGTHLRIACEQVAEFAHALAAKSYRYAKPGAPQTTPWGSIEFTVTDPFGNRLTFVQEE